MHSVSFSTFVQLPPRIAKAFFGRVPSWFDRVLFALAHGLIRFVYRLVPDSARLLTAYLRMRDRLLGPRNALARLATRASAGGVSALLDAAMPPRDPVVARARVAELRARSAPVDRVRGSPLEVGGGGRTRSG